MSNTQVNAALNRRSALRFGAVGAAATAATAVTVATASEASAAAGQAVLQGRVNTPGATDTSIIAPTAGIAFTVKNTGTGAAGYFFAAKGNGFAGGTAAGNKVGLSTANTGPASSGAAMGAVGVNNTGVQASTNNADRFGLTATNFSTTGEGEGGGLYAEGGEAPGVVAISNIGLPAVVSVGDLILADGHEIVFTESSILFGVTSDDGPEVTFSRTVQLSAAGAATVDLAGPSTDNVDLSAAVPLVSANSGPMPNLWITVTGTQVKIAGGTANGTASFRIVGMRTDFGFGAGDTKDRRTAAGVTAAKRAVKAAKGRANRT